MTKVEIGNVIALVAAVAAGAVYVGVLQGRVSALEKLDLEGMRRRLEAAAKQYSPVPARAILAWAGQSDKMPEGWVVCGQGKTLKLDGKFLMGTSNWNEIGKEAGKETHRHGVAIPSGWETEGRYTSPPPEGADNDTGKNWTHRHEVHGETKDTPHIPPSVKVFFLCKE